MSGRRLRRVAQHLLGCSVSGEEERSRGPRLSSMGKLIDPAEASPDLIFAPGGHCDYYGTKGFLDPDPGLRRELQTEELMRQVLQVKAHCVVNGLVDPHRTLDANSLT